MISQVRKRDGKIEAYNKVKIADAIFKAAIACDGDDRQIADDLANQVENFLCEQIRNGIPSVEEIQDAVEKILIENGHAKVAKAYILYREKRNSMRNMNALVDETVDLFSKYLDDADWATKENANTDKSVSGLNNYVREAFTKKYWLNEVYPSEVKEAHESGAIHLHDLGFFGAYCVICQWYDIES